MRLTTTTHQQPTATRATRRGQRGQVQQSSGTDTPVCECDQPAHGGQSCDCAGRPMDDTRYFRVDLMAGWLKP